MHSESNKSPQNTIHKFESMLKTDDVYFFDAEDFEDIVHHYLNNGKILLSKKAVKLGLEQHPHSIELKLLQVELHVFDDEFEKALQLLEELESLEPLNEDLFIQKANICSKQDQHEEAVKLLEKALQIDDNNFDIHALIGMEYLFIDDYYHAKIHFLKCVEIDPTDYGSLYNLVYCFEFLNDQKGAIRFLNEFVEKNPYCEVAWHQLGKMYLDTAMLKEALVAFDFAIISDDRFVGAYFEKGRVLEKLHKYNEAIICYETTIEIDQPTAFAYLRMGQCHHKLNNFVLAKQYYYKTIHEDPLLDKGWIALTQLYFEQKNLVKAEEYIHKALNIDNNNPKYWKNAAVIYIENKDWHQADFAFRRCIDLGDLNKENWFKWILVLLHLKDYYELISVLERAIDLYPNEVDFTYLQAGVLSKTGHMTKSKQTFEKAWNIDPQKKSIVLEYFPEILNNSWAQPYFIPFDNRPQ